MPTKAMENLHFYHRLMDKIKHLDILKNMFKQIDQNLHLGWKFMFQENNDSKHAAKIFTLWF